MFLSDDTLNVSEGTPSEVIFDEINAVFPGLLQACKVERTATFESMLSQVVKTIEGYHALSKTNFTNSLRKVEDLFFVIRLLSRHCPEQAKNVWFITMFFSRSSEVMLFVEHFWNVELFYNSHFREPKRSANDAPYQCVCAQAVFLKTFQRFPRHSCLSRHDKLVVEACHERIEILRKSMEQLNEIVHLPCFH